MHNTFRRRLAFILFASITIWVFLWYKHNLVKELNRSNRKDCETIAWLWAGVQYPLSFVGDESGLFCCSECGFAIRRVDQNLESDSLFCSNCNKNTLFLHTVRLLPEEREEVIQFTQHLFGDLVTRLDFPTIFSDRGGYPQIADGEVTDGFSAERIEELKKRMKLLELENMPIPIIAQSDTIGFLYFGTTPLHSQMQMMPFLELGLLLLIAAVLFMFIRTEISHEKDMSWVGFARETAHQISTPLSSLMGWLELLKDDAELSENSNITDAVEHMGSDVTRLNSIAQRYGQMGRKPKLTEMYIEDTVTGIVDYFNARKGLLGHGVFLDWDVSSAKHVILGNSVLLGWVLENLIKNAVASCAANIDGGKVLVSSEIQNSSFSEIEIRVSDNGIGIPYKDQGKIFKAGFTTRKGGWGLGLSLAVRIIEEYHDGSIRLLSSTPGKGTVFSILLPLKGKATRD